MLKAAVTPDFTLSDFFYNPVLATQLTGSLVFKLCERLFILKLSTAGLNDISHRSRLVVGRLKVRKLMQSNDAFFI